MKKGFFSDIIRGLYLATISCAWLGFLIAMRILNWNPPLWNDFSNVIGVLIFIPILYALLGVLAGLFFTFGLKIFFIIFTKNRSPQVFTRIWLIVYSGFTILIFAFLTITRTRPTAHVLIFDTPLVILYCFSLLTGYWIFVKSISKTQSGIFRITIIPILAALIAGFAVSYFGTKKEPPASLGNPQVIGEALSSVSPTVKTAIFGIDGAEWRLIDSLIAQGKMPTISKLIQKGARARLESLQTLKSPLIWTSIATGKMPYKHGIEDFGSFQFPLMKNSFIRYPDGIGFYRLVSTFIKRADIPVTSTTRKVEAFWDILSQAGKTVEVVGWWATWPVDQVNGVMVSDRFTYTLFNPRVSARVLKSSQVYPPELLAEITTFVHLPQDMSNDELSCFIKGDISENLFPSGWQASGRAEWNPLYQLKLAYTSSQSFYNTSLYLSDKEQSDLFVLYLEGNDMVSHFFWQYMDPSQYPDSLPQTDIVRFNEVVPRFYCYWDSLVGEAVKHFSNDTDIIIVSDHGFGPDPQPKVPFRGGEHQPYGILLASGPHFKSGYNVPDASVLDFTPTLLYLYGLPTAKDMDGMVLREIFTDDFLASHPMKTISSYETGRRTISRLTPSSIDEQIKEQLRSLGYTK